MFFSLEIIFANHKVLLHGYCACVKIIVYEMTVYTHSLSKVVFCIIPFVDVPELNLTNLSKELELLTRPVEFGIALGIPQHVLETIEADKPHGECIKSVWYICE